MFKKIVIIATASLIAFAFTGCSKKPKRPNPLDTVMGQDYGGNRGGDNDRDIFTPGVVDGEGFDSPGARRGSSQEDIIASAERGYFQPIYFAFDSSSITAPERAKLDAVVEFIQQNPGAALVLEGHCDWRGTQEYNLALGDRRAKSVQSYLSNRGIGADKLITLSKGDLEATEGASSAQMTRERKVEILVSR